MHTHRPLPGIQANTARFNGGRVLDFRWSRRNRRKVIQETSAIFMSPDHLLLGKRVWRHADAEPSPRLVRGLLLATHQCSDMPGRSILESSEPTESIQFTILVVRLVENLDEF
jgi:hypothetical protein